MHVNKSFNFNEHRENMLTKANQKFGVLKRTCHFVTHSNRRQVLYLALVSGQKPVRALLASMEAI